MTEKGSGWRVGNGGQVGGEEELEGMSRRGEGMLIIGEQA